VKIFRFERDYDFGWEYYLDLIKTKRFTVVSAVFFEEIYGSPPCLSLTFGFGQLFEFLIGFHWFTFKIKLFARNL
jgi:hypothetical protein